MKKIYFVAIFAVLCSCKVKNIEEVKLYESRYSYLLEQTVDSMSIPRSMSLQTGKIHKVQSKDWTSGFFAGNLWQLYELTQNIAFKEKAMLWTSFIEKEKHNGNTHDMGFKVYSSYGKGASLAPEKKAAYDKVIVESANTLITRYSSKVHAIRSWDFNKDIWSFPVIIDNMLNLELLFEASIITNDAKYRDIAIQHANTTLKNHFREDNSCYHVVDYDPQAGNAKSKVTHQGFSDESSWARGQAWAIYGYTMAYRYTKDVAYLKQAEATANYFITNKNMPADGIPYWDFKDPSIPNAPRDVSAATTVSSGLVELYTYTKNKMYLDYAKKVITTLNSPNYVIPITKKGPFILDHSTGNWPKKDEIDEPIVYGDYYFLETLLRLKAL
ncbi:glycoside hydrolase family 88 protein [Flavobacterium algicola]|uniref:glycoside hydrolase family 88 protein n=1 Tax=Flavobacterium algicola TaxID=556529 RepID=UPI001EFE88D9|nr:glycoside hydrolase family 88 protein [Flavobacterium algicola]MCG9790882.1 glycoside hydrolase family 88 protein [Flavobacterium algicola]